MRRSSNLIPTAKAIGTLAFMPHAANPTHLDAPSRDLLSKAKTALPMPIRAAETQNRRGNRQRFPRTYAGFNRHKLAVFLGEWLDRALQASRQAKTRTALRKTFRVSPRHPPWIAVDRARTKAQLQREKTALPLGWTNLRQTIHHSQRSPQSLLCFILLAFIYFFHRLLQ